MAIDSSLYAVSIPAGTYSAGDKIPLTIVRGPKVVRDGYGTAIMKRIVTVSGQIAVNIYGHIEVKNQNWIDSMSNACAPLSLTTLAVNSSAIQRCGEIELQPNSSFEVVFVVDVDATPTSPTDYFCLIDIDYPSVNAVANPKFETGAPTTENMTSVFTTTATGNATNLVWSSQNVDIFKAGFRYLLAEMGFRVFGITGVGIGFFSISGAAGQAGLERIIPCAAGGASNYLRYDIDYSTPLTKGPMTINLAAMSNSSTSGNALVELDFIRR